MKALILAATLVAAGVVVFHQVTTQIKNGEVDELWSQWKIQFEKDYTATEEAVRKAIFTANYVKVMAHNSNPEKTFTMGMTKFADLTNEEFAQQIRCLAKSENEGLGDPYCPGNNNCPSLPSTNETSWDWRSKGAVTKVKNQGQCGSCWAFSTTGSLEGLYKINKGVLLSFSEQMIVDCDSECDACGGCFVSYALRYTAKQGILLEKLYPYKGYQQQCRIPNNAKFLHVNNGYQCVQQKSESQLLASVVQQPTSVDVFAAGDAWQLYHGGIVKSDCSAQLDHAVLAVGFNTKEGYLLIKNSWGANWGENGYIRIGLDQSANDGYGICGIYRCANKAVDN